LRYPYITRTRYQRHHACPIRGTHPICLDGWSKRHPITQLEQILTVPDVAHNIWWCSYDAAQVVGERWKVAQIQQRSVGQGTSSISKILLDIKLTLCSKVRRDHTDDLTSLLMQPEVMDRDRRLTGYKRGQSDKAEAPEGFELSNSWRVR
jgi:hypothetical protein